MKVIKNKKYIALFIIVFSLVVAILCNYYNKILFKIFVLKCIHYDSCFLLDGNVSTKNADDLKHTLKAFLPVTFDKFKKDGGLIIISDKIVNHTDFYLNEKINKNVRGFFQDCNGKPTIWIDATDFKHELNASSTVLHEMAHYLDSINHYSSTTQFLYYYNNYSIDYKPKIHVDYGYQASNEKEFFACLFSDYIRGCRYFEMTSKVYKYINHVYNSTK